MTSIVKVEALSGAQDDGPLCYLLQVDEVYFLLDCGWDSSFDLSYMEAIKLRIPQINAVLITYPDIPHLGALPYLVGKCGLKCPIYTTVPVYKMGQLFCYDWLSGYNTIEDFTLFDFDDIDAAFEKVQQVKYSQTILLKGDNGLQITPFPAGHMIGGAVWRITKMGEEEIVYAVDFHHKRERHLNGCTFDGIGRPNLLITDAYNAIYQQQKRKQRDENLVSKLLSTVRDGGDVMVVIDTGGRVLEIAHLLDQLWQNREAGLMTYNLVMLNYVASSVVESAKSQGEFEWMSDKILKMFELGRHNPFHFRHVIYCHSTSELSRVRSPKVVLASGPDMESGFSRELFLNWFCSDTKNMVILTGRAGDRTLCSKLIRIAECRERKRPTSNTVTLEVKRRVRLEGAELDAYRARKREKEQEVARQRLETVRRNARLEHSDSSDDSDDEDVIAAAVAAMNKGSARLSSNGNVPTSESVKYNSSPYDIMARFREQQKASCFKQSKKQFPMFPFQEEKSKWDDYGEIIRPEEYIINEAVVKQPHVKNMPKLVKKEEEVDEAAEEMAPILEEWPTKCVSSISKVEVLCKLEFIEFEGRSDGESVNKILAQIKPKQLVIVHASAEATRHLADYCRQEQIAQKIFTPVLGEVIDATIESRIFQVTLSDQLMSSLSFQSVKDTELTWLDGLLRRKKVLANTTASEQEPDSVDEQEPTQPGTSDEPMEEQQTVNSPQSNQENAENKEGADDEEPFQSHHPTVRMKTTAMSEQLYLEALPSSNIPPHQSVFVNDPKLTDLKNILSDNGFQAEFYCGVLYINNVASLRRTVAGRFHFEGCACEDFYRIRDIIFKEIIIL